MAKFKVKINNPTFPKGAKIEVPPLGLLENGEKAEEFELSEEEAERIAAAFGVEVSGTSGKVRAHVAEPIEAPEEASTPEEEGGET